MKTYQAYGANDRRKSPELKTYRQLTSAEVRNGMRHLLFIGNDGKTRNCRASGQLKTWKTRPADYRLPVKFGLYESSALVPDRVDPSLATFEYGNGAIPVIEVTCDDMAQCEVAS